MRSEIVKQLLVALVCVVVASALFLAAHAVGFLNDFAEGTEMGRLLGHQPIDCGDVKGGVSAYTTDDTDDAETIIIMNEKGDVAGVVEFEPGPTGGLKSLTIRGKTGTTQELAEKYPTACHVLRSQE